ncbi:hypothetical protein BASA61_003816 [Batrachochytrium salamandrivorans]|nr:hypothetical protein BASA61_003816 [Batrachochytrium salamandrivorans]
MNIFMNSYALQFQQSHQLALVAQIYACSPYAQLDQYFGYWRQPPATYPVVGYPSQWSLQNNGFCSATPQSDFFGKYAGISLPLGFRETSNCSRARDTYKYPITSKEDQDTLPKMIRMDDTVDELLSSEVAHGMRFKQSATYDVCFASESRDRSAVFGGGGGGAGGVGAVTAQPHTSVHRTGDLEQALKKICVPTMRQKNGTTEQVRIPHAWEAALPATPKKERFHVKPKKPQTHSVTQASGRQNISGDVRNHPDLISTVKKNRHNTNRDGQPKIGPIKWK